MFTSTRIYSVVAACLTFAAGTIAARADILIVSPAAQAAVDGNGGNNFPFDIGDSVISSQRYQQVYSASDFAVLNGPALITEILFRPDSLNGKAFSTTLPAIQIDLSTTTAAPDALSAVFANNIGADDTVVYGPGPLALSSAFTGLPGGPKNFDVAIKLTHAFLYNPAAGNLLLDVRNLGGG